MKTNKFLLFSTLLFLTGCSNKTPSQSEINDELVKAFASCKMATIKNVIKNASRTRWCYELSYL